MYQSGLLAQTADSWRLRDSFDVGATTPKVTRSSALKLATVNEFRPMIRPQFVANAAFMQPRIRIHMTLCCCCCVGRRQAAPEYCCRLPDPAPALLHRRRRPDEHWTRRRRRRRRVPVRPIYFTDRHHRAVRRRACKQLSTRRQPVGR